MSHHKALHMGEFSTTPLYLGLWPPTAVRMATSSWDIPRLCVGMERGGAVHLLPAKVSCVIFGHEYIIVCVCW